MANVLVQQCRPFTVDGEQVLVRMAGAPTPEMEEAITDLVRAVHRKIDAEQR